MIYYCVNCEEKIEWKEEFLYECPECSESSSIFRLNEDDTELLKGKVIKEIYTNEWESGARLILFEDGEHTLIEMESSDSIDITLLEHEYDEEVEEIEEDENVDDETIFNDLAEKWMKKRDEYK